MPAPTRHAEAHEPHRLTDPVFLEAQTGAPPPPRLSKTTAAAPAPQGPDASCAWRSGRSDYSGAFPFTLPPGIPPPPLPPPGMPPLPLPSLLAPWPTPEGLHLPPPPPPPPPPAPAGSHVAAAADSPWGAAPPSFAPWGSYDGMRGAAAVQHPPPPPPPPSGAAAAHYSMPQARAPSRMQSVVENRAAAAPAWSNHPPSSAASTQSFRSGASDVRRDPMGSDYHADDAASSTLAAPRDIDAALLAEHHRRREQSATALERRQMKRLLAGAHGAFATAAETPPVARRGAPARKSHDRTPSARGVRTPRSGGQGGVQELDRRFAEAEERRRARDRLADARRMDVSRDQNPHRRSNSNNARTSTTRAATSRAARSNYSAASPSLLPRPHRRTDSIGATRRALKGDTPQLSDALRQGVQPRRLREAADDSAFVQRSPAKAAELISGVEDIFRRLRQTYVEFQRNPMLLAAAVSPAAGGALQGYAAATTPPPSSHPPGARRSGVGVVAAANLSALPPPPPSTQSRAGTSAPTLASPATHSLLDAEPEPSTEAMRLREELARLERQWEQLSSMREHDAPADSPGPLTRSNGGGGASSRDEVERRIAAMHGA